MTQQNSNAPLTPKAVAELLQVSEHWLYKRRVANDGPPYVKIGGLIRYRRADLDKWLNGQRCETSESKKG